MTSHARQSELYARLQEVLGPEPAETLMTMLPTADQFATKADLAVLATKTDLAAVRTEIRQDMRELRGELKSLARTFVVAQTTAVVGLTGIFIGVNQLL